jgi:hypothetical protein
MAQGRLEWASRGPIVVVLFTLVSVYTFAAIGMSSHLHRDDLSRTVQGATVQGTEAFTNTDVSDKVVQQLATSLSNIVSNDDELAVLPMTGGTGYTVSTTISVDDVPSSQDWRQAVSQDITQYFTDIYGQSQPVENAQVYFTKDGQIVAGAGLGKQVYGQLVATASTDGGGFVQSLQAQPVRTQQGAMDSWVEIEEESP